MAIHPASLEARAAICYDKMRQPAFSGKHILFADLDGTWLGKHRANLQRVIQQDPAFKTVEIAYNSGRTPSELSNLKPDLLPVKYYIGCEGCFLAILPQAGLPKTHDTGHAPWTKQLEAMGFRKPIVRKMMIAVANAMGLTPYQNQAIDNSLRTHLYFAPKEPSPSGASGNNPIPDKLKQYASMLNKIFELLGISANPVLIDFCHFFNHFRIVTTPKGIDKDAPLRFLMDKKHFSPSELIVAGDGHNDIPMFKADGRKIIFVGNNPTVLAHVKTLPAENVFIADPKDDPSDGVLKGLRHFLQNKPSSDKSP